MEDQRRNKRDGKINNKVTRRQNVLLSIFSHLPVFIFIVSHFALWSPPLMIDTSNLYIVHIFLTR